MSAPLSAGLLKPSPAERLQLVEDLWESIAADPAWLPPLTDEQRQEVERRYAAHLADPSSSLDWEEVRARLWARFS